MKFDIEDMRQFAEQHRGKYRTSGPHWSTVIRFPILFDEYEKAIARAEAAEERVYQLRNMLMLLLDQIDYTNGACRINEMVGAVLNINLIQAAHEVLKGRENE